MTTMLSAREQVERIQALELGIKRLKYDLERARRDEEQYMLRRTIDDSRLTLQKLYEGNL